MRLFEASAGTGKTYRLVQEYVAGLETCSPAEQLVVTFTNAAAAELRDRIREALGADGAEQLARAEITTIHGFCGRVLAQYSAECGHPPDLVQVPDAGTVLEAFLADFWGAEAATIQPLLDKNFGPARLRRVAKLAVAQPSAALVADSSPRGQLLARLAEAARAEIPARLAARGEMTFDGMLRAVERALPVVGPALRARFKRVFIDEFQDTDPTQWRIFSTLFGDDLVLIGDPKQAIYSFRQADVFTYQAATADLVPERLDRNYRSDAPLVQAVNTLFGQEGLFTHPTLTAPPVQAENERQFPGPALTIRWLPRQDGRSYLGPTEAQARVAQDVAADICAALADPAVRRRDCAVLVRSHNQAEVMRAALAQAGLAAVVRDRSNVFDSPAATDWRRVLQAVAEPNSTGAVKAALATRLLGLDAAALVDMDDATWGEWADRLRQWGGIWAESGPLALLDAALRAAYPRLLAQQGGARYVTDLRHAAELQQPVGGPFAQQIEWLAAQSLHPGEGARIRVEDDGDAVRIATIHSSKGLGYGHVWVPFAWVALKPHDEPDPVLYHAAGGLRLDVTPQRQAYAQANAERQAEDMRLLYVAATRARHRLALYWASAEGAQNSTLRRLLLDRAPRTDADVAEGLERWSAPDLIDVQQISPRRATPSPQPVPQLTLRAVLPPAHDPTWRRTSFSGLTRDAHEIAEAVEPDVALAHRVPLARFVAGAQIGTLIHEVLEHADFSSEKSVAEQVEKAVPRHGFSAEQIPQLTAALQAVVKTSLGSFALGDLARRLDELDFHLPVRGGFGEGAAVTPAELATIMRQHPGSGLPADYPDRLAALPTLPFRGFLSGAIDLVFEHDGRWYLADYKSNHLGDTYGDYTPPHLAAAVSRSHYVLQYHLYAVALHRYLRWRLPNYAYESHFGGAYYLFLRGMSPDLGPRAGVFFDRPPAALIEGWSACFEGR